VTPATPDVTPQSCLEVNLQDYGALGVTLRSNNDAPVFHIMGVFHSLRQPY